LALVIGCLLTCAGCASLPDAALEQEMPPAQAVAFDNARGPVSASKSAAIMAQLERNPATSTSCRST